MEERVVAKNVCVMADTNNSEDWVKSLDPENLKSNLLLSSLYIATFESFKDYVIDQIKYFYWAGLDDGKEVFFKEYNSDVKSLDKSVVKASLMWLQKEGAIEKSDVDNFDTLRQYRNKLAHELMGLIFNDLTSDLPSKFTELIELRIKIERWWIFNIEIPKNPDFDSQKEIKEEDVTSSSQMFNRMILDMLSGDEKTANYYQNEYKKRFKKK